MNKTKKLLSCALALVFILSMIAAPVSAAETTAAHTHTPSATGVCTGCGLNVLGLLNQAYIYSFPLRLMQNSSRISHTLA